MELVVPLGLWGGAFSHHVTAVELSHTHKRVYTGSSSGELVMWSTYPMPLASIPSSPSSTTTAAHNTATPNPYQRHQRSQSLSLTHSAVVIPNVQPPPTTTTPPPPHSSSNTTTTTTTASSTATSGTVPAQQSVEADVSAATTASTSSANTSATAAAATLSGPAITAAIGGVSSGPGITVTHTATAGSLLTQSAVIVPPSTATGTGASHSGLAQSMMMASPKSSVLTNSLTASQTIQLPSPPSGVKSPTTATTAATSTPIYAFPRMSAPMVLMVARCAPVVALCIAVSRSEEVLCSLSVGPSLKLWSAEDGHCVGDCPAISNWMTTPTAMVTMVSRRHIACSGDSREIIILDLYSRKVTSVIHGHQAWVNCLYSLPGLSATSDKLSPRQRPVLVSSSKDGAIMLWRHTQQAQQSDLLLGTILLSPTTIIRSLRLSPNQCLLLVVTPFMLMLFYAENEGQLLSTQSCSGGVWDGGAFVDNETVVAWKSDGSSLVYSIQPCVMEPSKNPHPTALFTSSAPPIPTPQPHWVSANLQVSTTTVTLWKGCFKNGMYATCGGGTFPNMCLWALPPHSHLTAILATPTNPLSPVPPRAATTPSLGVNPHKYSVDSVVNFVEGWKGTEPSRSNITSSCLLEDVLVLICGLKSGEITTFVLPNDLYSRTIKAHSQRVTCLLAPPPKANSRLLVSAGDDFCIKIWELFSFEIKYVLCTHSGPITRLLLVQPIKMPTDQGNRYADMKNSFMSVGQDHSVGIYSLETFQCQHWFYGHPAPIVGIYWNVYQDYLLIACSDGTLSIWEMTSGRLVSRLSGPKADEALRNYSITLLKGFRGNESQTPAEDLGITTCTLNLGLPPDSAPLQVIKLDIKKICKQLNDAPQTNPALIQRYYRWAQPRNSPYVNDIPGPTPPKNLTLAHQPGSTTTPATTAVTSTTNPATSASNVTASSSSTVPGASLTASTPTSTTTTKLADAQDRKTGLAFRFPPFSIISYLITWGVNDEIDTMCRRELSLRPPVPSASVGLVGPEGRTLSFMFPAMSSTARFGHWQISAHMSGSLQLAAATIAKTLLHKSTQESSLLCSQSNTNAYSQLLSYFCAMLPERISHFEEPSLSLMTSFWTDPSSDVMHSARSLFGLTVDRLKPAQLSLLAKAWGKKIQPDDSESSHSLEVLMLAILAAKHPTALDKPLANLVISQLLQLIAPDNVTPISSAAVDLIAQGINLWLTSMDDPAPLIRALFLLVQLGDKHSISKPASNTLLLVANAKAKRFLELMDSELQAHHNTLAVLSTINQLILKYSKDLVNRLPQLIETLLHAIDPRTPIIREHSYKAVVDIFIQLSHTFPQVSFSTDSASRVAVGSRLQNTWGVNIYDLKSASLHSCCYGHTEPVTCLAFSPSGKYLASYSAADGSVRVFNLQTAHTFLKALQINAEQIFSVDKIEDLDKKVLVERVKVVWQLRKSHDTLLVIEGPPPCPQATFNLKKIS
ncbi:WD repeat protein 7 [Pelomyxa schiedti]|nr:WD repeat protein 7 [Pelomyxa schiedti]